MSHQIFKFKCFSVSAVVVYSKTNVNEQTYDYSTVFYKGHIRFAPGGSCGIPSCTATHTGIWGKTDQESIAIYDYGIDSAIKSAKTTTGKVTGTHDFVFMWSCGHASPTYVGSYGAHSSGVMASWMQLNPNTLSSNGYTNPDYSDQVFIGFDWLSIDYGYKTTDPTFNHAQWTYMFYHYLLEEGLTVNDALDKATQFTYGISKFENSPLYNNFYMWHPNVLNYPNGAWELSRLHVWGDGSVRLPR